MLLTRSIRLTEVPPIVSCEDLSRLRAGLRSGSLRSGLVRACLLPEEGPPVGDKLLGAHVEIMRGNMDSSLFDRWTREVARGRSRRSLVRALAVLVPTALAKSGDAHASLRCYGHGCPCIFDRNCTAGLHCCDRVCQSARDCGLTCHDDGETCPDECEADGPCASCCGAICTADGQCATLYYAEEGEACESDDPDACAPGLRCCLTPGDDSSDGICAHSCFSV